MADNEDDSSSTTRTITAAEPPGAAATQSIQPAEVASAAGADQSNQPGEGSQTASGAETSQPGERNLTPAAGSGAQLADLLQSCPDEQNILVGTEISSLGPDLVNTTIIYVQPDGSLVEGSGMTAEEQQALLEQLTKQQIVQVSDSEAAQLLQQSQLVKTVPVHSTALDPSQLQQVINKVTKSQQQVQVPQQTPKQQGQAPQPGVKQPQQVQIHQQTVKSSGQNNASQQLKSVAQQVALQTGGSAHMVQKKVSLIAWIGLGLLNRGGLTWSRLIHTDTAPVYLLTCCHYWFIKIHLKLCFPS